MAKRKVHEANSGSNGFRGHKRRRQDRGGKSRVTESNAIPMIGNRLSHLPVKPTEKLKDVAEKPHVEGGSNPPIPFRDAKRLEVDQPSRSSPTPKKAHQRAADSNHEAKGMNGAGHLHKRKKPEVSVPVSREPKEIQNCTPAKPARSNDAPTSGESSRRREYIEDPRLTSLPQLEIAAYLAKNLIKIEDPVGPSFRPIMAFSYLPTTNEEQLAPFATFSNPTPIQAAAWPSIYAGRDVVGIAETGSGKTLAFGVPGVHNLASRGRKKGVVFAVVSPTRELAQQIAEQLRQLAKPAGLEVACVYGGVSKDEQIRALRKASILVGTPGRLLDLLSEELVDLSKVKYLVLDEADRMLDKGFEEDVRKIIAATPSRKRQTVMFTATWPSSVRKLASSFMRDPVKITIGDSESGELRANTRIAQEIEVIAPASKESRLLQLLKEHQKGKTSTHRILVFVLYKKEAARVENFIRSRGYKVAGIHGDLSQAQRTASLDAFKTGKVPLLVATDVAARGLDIPSVKLVINVTFPLTVEDYVHRIGRTGRAGNDGKAITLFTENDKALSGA
jgi:ATP-dependent RNA helicase DBP3